MNKSEEFLKRYAFYIFLFITFIIMLFRTPFWDETHAFEIASLKLNEIFYLTRIEGHPILWYLILKPFTNIRFYPYSMFLINWVFTCSAVYLLFKKSHFSYTIKTLIAFSTPFLIYFAPVARCYGVGLFLIFLICTLHTKRFKKPYLYAILIVLASQTSLTAMIGVFSLGLIFLFELITRVKKKILPKKAVFIVFFIFLLTSLFTISEFIGVEKLWNVNFDESFTTMYRYALSPAASNIFSYLLRLSFHIAFFGFPYFMYKYSKKSLVFITLTYSIMAIMFLFAYPGVFWNHFWFFVWFIVCMWLYGKKILKIKFVRYVFLSILAFMLIPYAVMDGNSWQMLYSSQSKKIANYISSKPEYKKAKLYTLDWWSDISPAASVYLKQRGIKLYNMENIERGTFEDKVNISRYFHGVKSSDFDEFISKTPEDFYILTNGYLTFEHSKNCDVHVEDNYDMYFTTKQNKYFLKAIEYKPDNLHLIIYKVIKL